MLIAFCGRAGAGKSYAASYLCSAHGFERVRFAGPLKAMMMAFGLTERQVDGDEKEMPCALLGGRTPRYAMQTLGTEWGRELIDPELWRRAWAHRVDAILAEGGRVVVDDCRFMNEATAIWKRGGRLVRLLDATGAPAIGGDHVSERMDFPCDVTIHNDRRAGLFDDLDRLVVAHREGAPG